jgi:hypothetical protein
MFTKRTTAAAVAVLSAVAAGLVPAPAQAALVPETARLAATFNGTVLDVVYRGSVIYVAGEFTTATDLGGEHERQHVAAISAATGQVLPWAPKANGTVSALAVTKHEVILGGEFTRVGAKARSRIALVSQTTGKALRALKPAMNGPVRSLSLTRGTLYVGGQFTRVNRDRRARLAAFERHHYRLTGWHPRANGPVRVVQAIRNGVYVGGEFTKLNRTRKAGFLTMVDRSRGKVTPGFDAAVTVPVYDVLRVHKRTYVAAGGPGGLLIALNRRGARSWAKPFDGDVQTLARLGRVIYAGGHYANVCRTERFGMAGACRDGGTVRNRLAAFKLSGRMTAWSPDADSDLGVVTMAASARRAELAIGGRFNTLNGGTTQHKFAIFGGS